VSRVKLLLVLTENETLVDPRDLRGLVDMAVQAEAAGIDGIMMSEHVLLGTDSGAAGPMTNPRDYAAPGNQDPAYAWPNSVVMLSAIAQATTTLRLVAGAIIAPLRHPLLLAKELGTLDLLSQGRLVVLPTVSWSKDEYAALGVPFAERGKILDEQLEVLAKAWGPYPIRHEGQYFSFDDVWLEPGAHSPEGPTFWFGGQGMHPPLVRRLARYGHGLNPFGSLSDDDLAMLAAGMREAGRDISELEMVGGIRGTFHGRDDVADLDLALESLPGQLAQGYTTICFKPAMFVQRVDELSAFYAELIEKTERIAESASV
jgi:alkanesulfonate monooxygenase SsuD/methylene tetrahydromethanopterin reductase-like flavin-dependent oxidoreductase (luciferase family)